MITQLIEKILKQRNSTSNYLFCQSEILIKNIAQLEKEAGSLFTDAFIPFAFPEGHLLIKEGEISKRLWLMETGVARRFTKGPDKEQTLNFFQPGEFIDNYYSSTFSVPSNVNIELMQASTGYYIEWATLEELKKTFPLIGTIEKQIIACDIRNKELHERCYLGLNAKEHYLFILEKRPYLILCATLSSIASFIGVNNATLSRIRAGFVKKRNLDSSLGSE